MTYYILAKGNFVANGNTKDDFYKEILRSRCLVPYYAAHCKKDAIEKYLKDAGKLPEAFPETSLFGNTVYLGECVFLIEKEIISDEEINKIRVILTRVRIGQAEESDVAKEIAYFNKAVSTKTVIFATSDMAKGLETLKICSAAC